MAHEPVLEAVPGTRTIATLTEFTLMAECDCGHQRELHTLFLPRQLGAGVTLAGVRHKLRCHKYKAEYLSSECIVGRHEHAQDGGRHLGGRWLYCAAQL
jgi:hypothetical protein